MDTAMKRAIAALEKRQFSRALAPLLDVWATSRSTQIAAFIERASARFTRSALPAGGTLESKQARWLQLAAARDPGDVPRLVAALSNGSEEQALARLEVLASLPPDPRIAAGLARLVAASPFGEAFTTRATELVRTLGSNDGHVFARGDLEALEALLDGSGSALLAAIHNDPDDSSAYAVYADWLLEQNDPQGELINLQLSGANSSRERELLRKLERKLVGPLIWKVTREPRTFKNGFLAGVILAKSSARALAAATAAPEWATVREVSIETPLPAGWFGVPNLNHVRSVRGADRAVVEHLAFVRNPPLALDTLGTKVPGDAVDELVKRPGSLSGLRTLAAEDLCAPFSNFDKSPLRDCLVRLEVATLITHIGRWLQAVDQTSIQDLAITNDPQIRCTRTPRGPWQISVPLVDWNAALAGNLAAGLVGIEALAGTTVHVAKHEPRYLVHVEKALQPFGSRVRYV